MQETEVSSSAVAFSFLIYNLKLVEQGSEFQFPGQTYQAHLHHPPRLLLPPKIPPILRLNPRNCFALDRTPS